MRASTSCAAAGGLAVHNTQNNWHPLQLPSSPDDSSRPLPRDGEGRGRTDASARGAGKRARQGCYSTGFSTAMPTLALRKYLGLCCQIRSHTQSTCRGQARRPSPNPSHDKGAGRAHFAAQEVLHRGRRMLRRSLAQEFHDRRLCSGRTVRPHFTGGIWPSAWCARVVCCTSAARCALHAVRCTLRAA